jgi:hypothetical protein
MKGRPEADGELHVLQPGTALGPLASMKGRPEADGEQAH